jgi:hypothetical protein
MSDDNVLKSRTFAADRRTWLVTIVGAVALWVGTTMWLSRRLEIAPRRPASDDDGRFIALVFDRVAAIPDGGNLDRVRLRDELRAIAAAGWQPVTLAELRDAYRGDAKLPARPVLITFDEGYLATYEAADPVLRELRWPAVMFLRTERQEARDVSYLLWDRLRRMVATGLWEVGSGDPAPDPPEGAGEFPARPPGHALIAERLGRTPVPAWAPRGADPLNALGNTPSAPGVPWLGFADDVTGANDTAGSPFRIARLRVRPDWSRDELLRRMSLALEPPGAENGWVAGEGAVTVDGTSIVLSGRPRAEIWLPATRWADSWVLDAHVRPGAGEFWIAQPGDAPGREWRFGVVGGRAYLQDRAPGRPPYVIASADSGVPAGGRHAVHIVKRGRGVWIVWNGRPLRPTPIPLPSRWNGKTGIIAFQSGGVASLTIDDLKLVPFPYAVRTVASSPRAEDVALLARDAPEVAALSPPWATIGGTTVAETDFDRDLFSILGGRFAFDIMPTIEVRGDGAPAGSAAAWLASLPERLAAGGYQGVRLDLRDTGTATQPAWTATARDLDMALRRSGRRLVLVTR